MAKARKLPKSPKQSASLETWKKHEDKVKEVKKHNAQLLKDKETKKSVIARVRKERSK